jgi:hypothetical protein
MGKKIRIYSDFALRENERQVALDGQNPTENPKKSTPSYYIKNFIHQSKYGPAGLLHAFILSKILRRCIRVWQNGRIVCSFGKPSGKIEIDIECKKGPKDNNKDDSYPRVGHWINVNGGNEWTASQHNDCLYEVIASQTGIDPLDLRCQTIRAMRLNERTIAKFVSASVDPLAMLNSFVGGASYRGTSPYTAKILLDASEQGECHPERRQGHPRGHAYHPFNDGRNVQNYSLNR